MTQMESIYDVIDERDRHVLRQAMTWHMEKMSSTSDSDENWLRDVANESRERSDSTANELTFMCRLNSVTKCVRNGTAQLISKTSFDNVKVRLQFENISTVANTAHDFVKLTSVVLVDENENYR